jgi:hypothetical protein
MSKSDVENDAAEREEQKRVSTVREETEDEEGSGVGRGKGKEVVR